jgi:methylated-DNA-[protein]-cysteine S-methyltransferase
MLWPMRIETPFGPAWAGIDADGALTKFSFGLPRSNGGHSDIFERQLAKFFAGERHDFDLALAPEGTEFQKRVWVELVKSSGDRRERNSDSAR